MSDAPFNGRTALVLRLAAVLVPLSLVLSSVAAVGGYVTSRHVADQNHRLEAEIEAREVQSCARVNESRGDLRSAFVDTLTDNLVAAAENPPDPARVKAYRSRLLADLEAAYPDRDCAAEAKARR